MECLATDKTTYNSAGLYEGQTVTEESAQLFEKSCRPTLPKIVSKSTLQLVHRLTKWQTSLEEASKHASIVLDALEVTLPVVLQHFQQTIEDVPHPNTIFFLCTVMFD